MKNNSCKEQSKGKVDQEEDQWNKIASRLISGSQLNAGGTFKRDVSSAGRGGPTLGEKTE